MTSTFSYDINTVRRGTEFSIVESETLQTNESIQIGVTKTAPSQTAIVKDISCVSDSSASVVLYFNPEIADGTERVIKSSFVEDTTAILTEEGTLDVDGNTGITDTKDVSTNTTINDDAVGLRVPFAVDAFCNPTFTNSDKTVTLPLSKISGHSKHRVKNVPPFALNNLSSMGIAITSTSDNNTVSLEITLIQTT